MLPCRSISLEDASLNHEEFARGKTGTAKAKDFHELDRNSILICKSKVIQGKKAP